MSCNSAKREAIPVLTNYSSLNLKAMKQAITTTTNIFVQIFINGGIEIKQGSILPSNF